MALAARWRWLLADLVWTAVRAGGTRRQARRTAPRRSSRTAASVVIPNWNGKDLLEKYLPSVVEALAGNPAQRNHGGG